MEGERVKTGIQELDAMLGGGFLPETVNLVEGAAGTGKTILGLQYICNGILQFDEPGVILAQITNPLTVVFFGLGLVPVAFSLLFYLVPILRRTSEKRRNRVSRRTNFQRRIYRAIADRPLQVKPQELEPADDDEKPSDWRDHRRRVVEEYAARKDADVEETAEGTHEYRFSELAREQRDMSAFRDGIDPAQYSLGNIVFDSGSETTSN